MCSHYAKVHHYHLKIVVNNIYPDDQIVLGTLLIMYTVNWPNGVGCCGQL